jgi:hypothetical protein
LRVNEGWGTGCENKRELRELNGEEHTHLSHRSSPFVQKMALGLESCFSMILA